MNLFECLRLAFNSLMANKLRSLLTMLGIIIGIGAVITITTLGTSVGKTLNKSFDSMGFNFVEIDVYPRPELDPEEVDVRPDDFFSLDMIHGLVSEYPDRFGWVVMDESVGTGEINNYKDQTIKAEISGVGDGNLDLRTLRIIMGRNITFRDIM